MTADVDLVIIGAGPVGLAASIEARLAGLTVAVIEPRHDAIDKACGEGLMPGALAQLARLGVDPEGMPLRGVSYRSGSRHADHRFRVGEGRGVRRTTLHDALATRAAQLGVRRIDDRVDTLVHDAGGVTVSGIRARYAFGCDGLHSAVRRNVGLDREVARGGRRFGLRQHFTVEPWSDLIEVYWSDRVEAYVTPVSENLVGIAMLGTRQLNFEAALAAIPELAGRLCGVAVASTLRGAGPFRQRAASAVIGRVLLVGDASGYIDAITGEGLRVGFEQARAAVECVVAGRPQDYAQAWNRATRDFRLLTTALVGVATGPLRAGIVPAARAFPVLYGSIVERLAR